MTTRHFTNMYETKSELKTSIVSTQFGSYEKTHLYEVVELPGIMKFSPIKQKRNKKNNHIPPTQQDVKREPEATQITKNVSLSTFYNLVYNPFKFCVHSDFW